MALYAKTLVVANIFIVPCEVCPLKFTVVRSASLTLRRLATSSFYSPVLLVVPNFFLEIFPPKSLNSLSSYLRISPLLARSFGNLATCFL